MPNYGTHATELYLINVPWDASCRDEPEFGTPTAQFNYFIGLDSFLNAGTDFRFIDGRGESAERKVRVNIKPEVAQRFNYCMYNNFTDHADTDNLNHTYAFIKSVDFINYETAELTLKVDPIQTYMFSYEVQPGLIVNETVDETLSNILRSTFKSVSYPEDVDTTVQFFQPTGNYYYICATQFLVSFDSEYPGESGQWDKSESVAKLNDKMMPFAFVICHNFSDVRKILHAHEKEEGYDMNNIVCVGAVSRMLFPSANMYISTQNSYVWIKGYAAAKMTPQNDAATYAVRERSFNKPTAINGGTYTPMSAALMASPYYYPRLNAGGKILPLAWEESSDPNKLTFGIDYYFTDGWKAVCYPKGYSGQGVYSIDNTMSFELPVSTCIPYSTDTYLEYMRQSRVQREQARDQQIGSSVLGGVQIAIGAAATAFGGGAAGVPLITSGVASLGTGVGGMLMQSRQNQLNEQGSGRKVNGQYVADTLLVENEMYARFENVQIRQNCIREFDKYIQMYGYPINSYGIPTSKNREAWHYIQTSGCRIKPTGDYYMSEAVVEEIQELYNRGITFWQEPAHVGDYEYYNYKNEVRTQ